MFCSSCGAKIPDHSKYCLECGCKVGQKAVEYFYLSIKRLNDDIHSVRFKAKDPTFSFFYKKILAKLENHLKDKYYNKMINLLEIFENNEGYKELSFKFSLLNHNYEMKLLNEKILEVAVENGYKIETIAGSNDSEIIGRNA